jgi:hypothetical protein
MSFLRVSGQVAQLGDLPWRDKAGTQQPALGQLCQPHAVGNIGLTAGEILHMLGIDQHQLQPGGVFQRVPHRLPIHAGGFHNRDRDALGDQPLSQRPQRAGERAELAHQLTALPAAPGCANARHHRFLVHIQPGTSGDQHLHRDLLSNDAARGAHGSRI